MADNTPYFVMAFADPKGDLAFVEKEYDSLAANFSYWRNRNIRTFDYELIRKADGIKISTQFANLVDRKIALFHFSGHASQVALKLQDQNQTALALSAIIDKYTVKILFLNACSTAALVKDLFANTQVSVIIATNDKVKDDQATEVSNAFYDFFIHRGYSIRDSFKQVYGYGKCAAYAVNELNSKLRYDDSDKEIDKLSHDSDFKWGIFCSKDDAVLNYTVDTLFGSDEETINTLTEDIAEKKREMKELAEGVAGLEHLKNNPGLNVVYDQQLKKLEKAKNDLKNLENDQLKLNDLVTLRTKEMGEQLKKNNFQYAVQQLNYNKQRGPCNLSSKTFAGLTILSDEDNMPDLLFRYFRSVNGLDTPQVKEIRISFTSSLADSFWWGMARELEINTIEGKKELAEQKDMLQTDKDMLIKKLVADIYLNGTLDSNCIAVNHVVLIITTPGKQEGALVAAILEFWQLVEQFIVSKNIAADKRNKWDRKIVCVLNDNNLQPGKETEWKKVVMAAPAAKIPLEILPAIEDLTRKDIRDWIKLHNLDTLGIQPADAAAIFNISKGKIKKVLSEVKSIVKKQNIEIDLLQNL